MAMTPFFFLALSVSFLCAPSSANGGKLQTYIILLEPPQTHLLASAEERRSWYESFLPKTTAGAAAGGSRLVHSYSDLIGGFAAKLSAEELESMQSRQEFIAAIPDRIFKIQTTRSPEFLGLNLGGGGWTNAPSGEGVIVGVLDTGADVGHPSFSAAGIPPPPPKWKGKCEAYAGRCNNKIIGYRVFSSGAADEIGHGTHTASTAAGAPVRNASVLGCARGTSAGVAPRAHLAIYKVCSFGGCSVADIVKAVDAAVEDGVDVISFSIVGGSLPLYADGLAVAAYRAARRGVLVSCAAGNDGPLPGSLTNEAPWVMTVAAATIDRSIKTTVKLGDGQQVDGESIVQISRSSAEKLPLVYPARSRARYCSSGSLSGVKGKVVVCDRGGGVGRAEKAAAVKESGGAGMILANELRDGSSTVVDVYSFPAVNIGFSDAARVRVYAQAGKNATAAFFFEGTVTGVSPSPAVASFSSRGPTKASPGILKPDIAGPGVSIVAAWPSKVGGTAGDFNVLSGTSMSTPHLSGVAAIVKSAHPDWSPAAVKSAIMTTADAADRGGEAIRDEKLEPASFFAVGAGLVNPLKAVDPGLVYDIRAEDYIPYLCSLGYSDRNAAAIVGRRIRCSEWKNGGAAGLNYPSISVRLGREMKTVSRTMTNVGEKNSVYSVKVEKPAGVEVEVSPEELRFGGGMKETLNFTLSFRRSGGGKGAGEFSEGKMMWVSGKRVVGSPISVSFV